MGQPGRHRYDPFELDDVRSYAATKFYCTSTNANDHSDFIKVRVPQGYAGMLRAAGEKFPQYRGDVGAVVRDAIVHRLHYLNEEYLHDPAFEAELEIERVNLQVVALGQRMETLRRNVEKLTQVIYGARDTGDRDTLLQAIELAETQAQLLPEPYRGQVEELISEITSK